MSKYSDGVCPSKGEAKFWKSILFSPTKRPAGNRRRLKSLAGQLFLFNIDELHEKGPAAHATEPKS